MNLYRDLFSCLAAQTHQFENGHLGGLLLNDPGALQEVLSYIDRIEDSLDYEPMEAPTDVDIPGLLVIPSAYVPEKTDGGRRLRLMATCFGLSAYTENALSDYEDCVKIPHEPYYATNVSIGFDLAFGAVDEVGHACKEDGAVLTSILAEQGRSPLTLDEGFWLSYFFESHFEMLKGVRLLGSKYGSGWADISRDEERYRVSDHTNDMYEFFNTYTVPSCEERVIIK